MHESRTGAFLCRTPYELCRCQCAALCNTRMEISQRQGSMITQNWVQVLVDQIRSVPILVQTTNYTIRLGNGSQSVVELVLTRSQVW